MLTLRQFRTSLCCFGGSHAKENHASIFIAVGCDVCSLLARLVWVLPITAGVSSIAFFEPGHRFGWRHDRVVSVGRIAGVGNLAATDYACGENEECNTCLCHKCFFLLAAFGKIGWSGKWLNEEQELFQGASDGKTRGISYSLSRLKRCKMRWANGATISDAMPIKASPENKA